LSEIILPESYLRRQAALKKAGLFTFVTWSDVSENSVELDAFKTHLSSMPVENLIALISMISIIQTNTPLLPEVLRAQQSALARQICTSEIADKIERKINRGDRDALTSAEQLLQAAVFAILYGKSGLAEDQSNGSINELGNFLLKVNEVISTDDHGLGEKFSDVELLIKLSMQHHSRTLQEQPRYLLARYYDLLVTRSQEQKSSKLDFNQAMYEATGLGIEEFMALGFLYYTPFGDKSEVRQLAENNYWGMIHGIESRIRKLEIRERVQSLFASSLDEFRRAFKKGELNPLDASLLPFKKRPFYRTENGSAIPVSLPFVLEKFSVGTYWALHGWYCDQSKKALNSFTGFVGERFQDYITDLLVRTYSGNISKHHHFYREQDVIKASPGALSGDKPPFDGILVSNDSIVIFEMTTEGIPVNVLESGDPGKFTKEAKDRLGKKFEKQLSRACTGLANGTWGAPGLDRKKIMHIYPVLVLLHPYPQNVATWQVLQSHIPNPELIQCGYELLTAQVYHAQILTAEELEMLEPLLHSGQQSLTQLLQTKISDQFWVVQSMKNFMLRALEIQEQSNEFMQDRYDEVAKHMRQTIIEQVELIPE